MGSFRASSDDASAHALRDDPCRRGPLVAAGRRSFVDQSRGILLRHGGFSFESSSFSVDVYHDEAIVPGVLRSSSEELDLSDESTRLFSFYFAELGLIGPQEFGFAASDYTADRDANMLRMKIPSFDAAEALAYRDELLWCQGLIDAWDGEFRDLGGLRNYNPVRSIAFVVPARTAGIADGSPYRIRAGADAATIVISRECVA